MNHCGSATTGCFWDENSECSCWCDDCWDGDEEVSFDDYSDEDPGL